MTIPGSLAVHVIPLLAARIDWIEGLIPFLFVAFWIISQVINVVRRMANGMPRPPRDGGARPPRPAAADGDPRVDLQRQIEEFLRQTRPGEQRPKAPPPLPATPSPVRNRKDRLRPRSEPAAVVTKTPRLADRHLHPLGEAGDDVSEHVRDAFAHDLRHLSTASGQAVPDERPPAQSIVDGLTASLRDPASLRRLVVMREILDRPVDRWE